MAIKRLTLTIDEAYEIADSFAQASAKLLEFRIANNKELSDKDFDELERCEDELDRMVVVFRGYGIELIGAKAEVAVQKLTSAIASAKKTLGTISKIKKAITVAGALVDLAAAVYSKDPKNIIDASKVLIALANGQSQANADT